MSKNLYTPRYYLAKVVLPTEDFYDDEYIKSIVQRVQQKLLNELPYLEEEVITFDCTFEDLGDGTTELTVKPEVLDIQLVPMEA